LQVDGSSDLSLDLRDERPQARLLEVGIWNPNPTDLEGVYINVLMTEGIKARDSARCDHYGNPKNEGWWARPTPEAIGDDESKGDSYKDYWGADKPGLTITPHASILTFKLIFKEPGKYRVRVKLWGGDVGEETEDDAFVSVTAADELDEGRDAISEAIYRGERLRDAPVRGQALGENDPVKDGYMAWV
jgi:hypothetical protein